MGIHTDSGRIPFAAYIPEWGFDDNDKNYPFKEFEEDYHGFEPHVMEMNGWSYDMNKYVEIDDISYNILTKGKLEVLLLNQSEHSSVGGTDWTICAKTLKPLKTFLNDFSLGEAIDGQKRIEKNAKVYQTS